jgi:hypothetical protein
MPYHDPGKISSITTYKRQGIARTGTEKRRAENRGTKKPKEKENP